MTPSRRVKKVIASLAFLKSILTTYPGSIVKVGIPPTAKVDFALTDTWNGKVVLLVEDESFPEVKKEQDIPVLEIEVTQL